MPYVCQAFQMQADLPGREPSSHQLPKVSNRLRRRGGGRPWAPLPPRPMLTAWATMHRQYRTCCISEKESALTSTAVQQYSWVFCKK